MQYIKRVPCRHFDSDEINVLIINEWLFVASTQALPEDSTFIQIQQAANPKVICQRSSGPHDLFAQWLYYPREDVCKLLVTSYDRENRGDIHIVHTVKCIGDVMVYCAKNTIPHTFKGDPID